MNSPRIGSLRAIFLACPFIGVILPACSQPVGEEIQQDFSSKAAPRVEFYNWLYGTSRRSWFEWHTVTAGLNSSLNETGFRARAMGAVGGYVGHIKGNASESIFTSAYGLDDNVLPYLDTVGELQGMNGFGGVQFGYTYAADNWRVGGFIGGAVVRTWAIAIRMASPAIKFSADPGTLNGTRFGVLVSLEGELHPTDEVMLSTWSIYTPAYKWGYFEGKFGIAVPFRESISILKNAYFGPHMALNLSEGESQPMLGGHVTGLAVAGIYFNFTLGYTREKLTGNGVYSIVETSWQF